MRLPDIRENRPESKVQRFRTSTPMKTLETRLLAGHSGIRLFVVPTASYFERQIKAGVLYLNPRQVEAPESQEYGCTAHVEGGAARSRPMLMGGDLHLGYEMALGYNAKMNQGAQLPGRASRQLAHGLRPRGWPRRIRQVRAIQRVWTRRPEGNGAHGLELPGAGFLISQKSPRTWPPPRATMDPRSGPISGTSTLRNTSKQLANWRTSAWPVGY